VKSGKSKDKDKKKKSSKSSFNSLEELLEGNLKLFAEQVTLYEAEIIRSIKSHEYVKQVRNHIPYFHSIKVFISLIMRVYVQKWSGKGGKEAAPNIVRFIQHFNKLSFWFAYYITSQK